MQTGSSPRILLYADASPPDGVEAALRQAGYAFHALPLGEMPNEPNGLALIVVDGTSCGPEAHAACHRLRGRLGDTFIPILMITDEATPQARLASLQSGADAYILRPFAPAELLGQVQAFLRMKER